MARLDLAVWRRSPWAIAAAVIPPAGMLVLVKVLTVAVTAQPVALVVEDPGPQAQIMASLIKADKESYLLVVTGKEHARHLLEQQKAAAVIEIPKGFDAGVNHGRAELRHTLQQCRHRRGYPALRGQVGRAVRRSSTRLESQRRNRRPDRFESVPSRRKKDRAPTCRLAPIRFFPFSCSW